ncbi:MAG: hypothetical protein GY941_24535 [Planctomycetes bacterium]|nr:hypothetical protein [Planctomycetota bacterium]
MLLIAKFTNNDIIKVAKACGIEMSEFVAELKAKGIANIATEDDIEKFDEILDANE